MKFSNVIFLIGQTAASVTLAGLSSAAHAYVAGAGTGWWLQWTSTPSVFAATALIIWLYARGARRARPWQRAGFLCGTILLFLALQSPLDALAAESLAVHQLQHLVLLSLVPMPIALSVPSVPLIAGMPDWLRGGIYIPVASNRAVRLLFGLLSAPLVSVDDRAEKRTRLNHRKLDQQDQNQKRHQTAGATPWAQSSTTERVLPPQCRVVQQARVALSSLDLLDS